MAQAQINGISIEYEMHGAADAEPMLLIMGLGAQMTRWPAGLYEKLVARGFRVIRFDNRDVGLSQKFSGAPKIEDVIGAMMKGEKPDIPYTLDDMAADAVGLLDYLGITHAHIVGASMGGMIGQLVVADYPDRALSFTSIFSSTGNPTLPPVAVISVVRTRSVAKRAR